MAEKVDVRVTYEHKDDGVPCPSCGSLDVRQDGTFLFMGVEPDFYQMRCEACQHVFALTPGGLSCVLIAEDKPKKPMTKRGEDAAAAYLERVGLDVVERDLVTAHGTVPVVAIEGTTLVFCEVKVHKTSGSRSAEDLSDSARRRYTRIARAYAEAAGMEPDFAWRFDRVSILILSEDRALLRHHRSVLTSEEA